MEVGHAGESERDLLHLGEGVRHVDDAEAGGVGGGGAVEAVFERDHLRGWNA